MGDIREGYISVTGGEVWYRVVGANSKGIPLLTLHGGPGVPHDYLEPLESLRDERPVIFYDQLGCGYSDKPNYTSLWTIERFIKELEQVRAVLELTKVHILGQSWGTMLATDYMLTKPEGVVRLIFSGPAISASRFTQDTRAYLSELPEDIQEIIRESEAKGDFSSEEYQDAMMAFYRLHLCRVEQWPDCLNRAFEKLGDSVYGYMWGPSEFSVTGTLKDYERVDRLKEITIPVLFTCGRYDEATPAATKFYQSNLPGSEIAVLEDASHAHHIEKTEEYLQIVRDFLHGAEYHLSG